MSPNRIRQALHPGNTYGAAPHVEHDVRAVKLHFLASLNHEIRTPLSGMLGMVELLLETPLDVEQQDYVRAVRSCAATLYELLNDTLEYTALASDSVNLDVAEFDVLETLQSAHREFAALQAVPPGFVPDAVQDQLAQFFQGGSRAQWGEQVHFLVAQQAQAQFPIGGQPRSGARGAERQRD